MTRLTSDVSAVESFMVGQLTGGVSAVVQLSMFLTALFYLQWELTLAALVIVPAFWWIATKFAAFTKDVSRERRRRGGSLGSITEESLANVSLVQTFSREDAAVEDYHRQNRAIMDAELAGSRVRAVFLPMVDLAELVGVLTVVGLGVWALGTDRLSLGGLLAFLTLLTQCYGPVRELGNLVPSLFSASAGAERVVELLDVSPADDRNLPPLPGHAVRGSPAVELHRVTFSYPGAAAPALSDLSLQVSRGERLAIVGPSGVGKSTIARLLCRQIDPDRGRVLLDGHDVTAHSVSSVRASVTPVLQEQLLLDTTVRANIGYARPDATDAEIVGVAELADAHDFIIGLSDGYRTRIGQRGRSLSGGQRQRIAVARALLRPSPVLVLDEPTTGLDDESSHRLMSALMHATAGRTVIVLTHDTAVLDHVDRVVDLARNSVEATRV